MCLAVPAKVVTLEGEESMVDLHGNSVRVSTVLVPETRVGDWVLIHAGFAIQRLSEQEAAETFAVLEDVQAAEAATRPAI